MREDTSFGGLSGQEMEVRFNMLNRSSLYTQAVLNLLLRLSKMVTIQTIRQGDRTRNNQIEAIKKKRNLKKKEKMTGKVLKINNRMREKF